jgi:hypothetical protein
MTYFHVDGHLPEEPFGDLCELCDTDNKIYANEEVIVFVGDGDDESDSESDNDDENEDFLYLQSDNYAMPKISTNWDPNYNAQKNTKMSSK